jgi:VIT family
MPAGNKKRHRTGRIAWLRAVVLGANDGILSTSSLVLGVAAAHGTHSNVLVAGVAGLVAGDMSMAAGEYVSVHSQADTEQADLVIERAELNADYFSSKTDDELPMKQTLINVRSEQSGDLIHLLSHAIRLLSSGIMQGARSLRLLGLS